MTISFNTIPSNIRVPLFYGEVDNSQANTVTGGAWNALLLGQMLDDASATPLTPVIVSQISQANNIFGRGSQLARMVKAFRANCSTGQLYCIPIKTTGEKAKGRITVSGTSTEAGYINLYVGSDRVRITVTTKSNAEDIAQDLINGINAIADLPVTAEKATTGQLATSGSLKGGVVETETLLTALQAITDGSIIFNVDSQSHEVSNLDFSEVTSLSDVASALTEKVTTYATVIFDENHFEVVSKTSGSSSKVDFCSEPTEGTSIVQSLKLGSSDGGNQTVGIDVEDLSATVDIVAKSAGDYANDIKLQLDLRGAVGGEKMVNGISIKIVPMQNGVGTIDVEGAIAGMGDTAFDFIGLPWNDADTLVKIGAELNDISGRWSYSRMLYGHALTAKRGADSDDLNDLVAFGNTLNDQHLAVLGLESSFASPVFDVVGALTGLCATYINIDPARPLQSLTLEGIIGAKLGSGFELTERNTELLNGIGAQNTQQDGSVVLNRLVTTYKTNSYGDADTSYLDSERLWQITYIQRYIKTTITSKYPRHKIADDSTMIEPGQAVITTNDLKGEIVGCFKTLEKQGIVENVDTFKDQIIVERNTTDTERVDMLLPPDLINGLRVIAEQLQFRS